MREKFDGKRFEELPDWITVAFFRCLKEGYRWLRITEDYCPFCETSEEYKGFKKELFEGHQDDNFTVGIRIMKAIEKIQGQINEKDISNDFKKQVKDIIIDVLFKRFRSSKFGFDANEPNLSEVLKIFRENYLDKLNPQKLNAFNNVYETFKNNKKEFCEFLINEYIFLFDENNTTDEFPFEEEGLFSIIVHYIRQYKLQGHQSHIKQITVENLFGYHSYTLNMSKENLSVIIGTNGLGKTTVFNILECLLVQEENLPELFEMPFTRFNIELRNGGYIKIKKSNNVIAIESKREQGYTGNKHSKIKISKNDKKIADKVEEYRKIRDIILPEKVYKEKRFLFVRTKRLTANEIKNKMEKIISEKGFKNNFKFFNECFKSLYYEKDPSKKQSKIVDGKLSIETCKKVFDKEGKFEKVLDFNPKYLPKNKDVRGGDSLELENLSSGEINVLAILFEIWFMAKPGAMVLIDEPEISLHIAWQQRIGEIISEMVKEKKGVQVIVATHSPFLAASTPDSIVEAELN